MKLNDKVYDVLKWVVILLLPTLGQLYKSLASVWGWPLAAEISDTIELITVALGVILGISQINYAKQGD